MAAKKTTRRSRQMTDYQSLITRRFHSNRGQHLIKYIENIQRKIADVENETDADLLEEIADLEETRDVNLVSLNFNKLYRLERVKNDETRDLETLRAKHEVSTKNMQQRVLNYIEGQTKMLSSDTKEYTDISHDRASVTLLTGFNYHETGKIKLELDPNGSTPPKQPSVTTQTDSSGEESGGAGAGGKRTRSLRRRLGERSDNDSTDERRPSIEDSLLGIVWADSDAAVVGSGSERTSGRRGGRPDDSDAVDVTHHGRHKNKDSATNGLTSLKAPDVAQDLADMKRRF